MQILKKIAKQNQGYIKITMYHNFHLFQECSKTAIDRLIQIYQSQQINM